MSTDFVNMHKCHGSVSANAQSWGKVSTVLYANEVVEYDFDSDCDFQFEDVEGM